MLFLQVAQGGGSSPCTTGNGWNKSRPLKTDTFRLLLHVYAATKIYNIAAIIKTKGIDDPDAQEQQRSRQYPIDSRALFFCFRLL